MCFFKERDDRVQKHYHIVVHVYKYWTLQSLSTASPEVTFVLLCVLIEVMRTENHCSILLFAVMFVSWSVGPTRRRVRVGFLSHLSR